MKNTTVCYSVRYDFFYHHFTDLNAASIFFSTLRGVRFEHFKALIGARDVTRYKKIHGIRWREGAQSKFYGPSPAPALSTSQSSLLIRCSESASLFAGRFSCRPFVLSLLLRQIPVGLQSLIIHALTALRQRTDAPGLM